MIVYSNDFSADPEWTTDQPTNYYWDSAAESFVAKTINGVPDYTPNRYAFEEINLDVSRSFTISWDQRVIERDGYAISHFGLFADDLLNEKITFVNLPSVIPESTLNVGLGGVPSGSAYSTLNIVTE